MSNAQEEARSEVATESRSRSRSRSPDATATAPQPLPRKIRGISAKVFRPNQRPHDPLRGDVNRISQIITRSQIAPAVAAERLQTRVRAAREAAAQSVAAGATERNLKDVAWREELVSDVASAVQTEPQQRSRRPAAQPSHGYVHVGTPKLPTTVCSHICTVDMLVHERVCDTSW